MNSPPEWSWCTCALKYTNKCSGCGQPLRMKPGLFVHFRIGHWHVDCLLDDLTTFRIPEPLPPSGIDTLYP